MVKILIVDDEKDYCDMVRRYFVDKGCQVTVALNGIDGLKAIEDGKPDIVILDQHMVGLSGLEVLQQVRQRGQDIFVIMVTVDQEEETRQAATDARVDGYLHKPFSLAELSDLVIGRIGRLRRGAA